MKKKGKKGPENELDYHQYFARFKKCMDAINKTAKSSFNYATQKKQQTEKSSPDASPMRRLKPQSSIESPPRFP